VTTTLTEAPAIAVRGLRKAFGEHVVLDGVDLEIPVGSVLALLGPNGAGKTTIVHILSTLVAPDAGSVAVGGRDLATDPNGVRAVIGVTGQFSAVDDLLTGRENLALMARLRHLGAAEARRRVDELLERFDLVEAAGKRVSTFSGGMRRRLDLAMTLIGDPRIVFLDEPTTGLDPRSRRTMWDIVRGLAADGVTILLTTQHLDEADELASRVAVLDGGRIVAQGTPDELKRLVPPGHLLLRVDDAAALGAAAAALPDGVRDDEALTLRVPREGGVRALRAVLDRLDAAGVEAADLEVRTPNLDDVFFALTGHGTTAHDTTAHDTTAHDTTTHDTTTTARPEEQR
jgi:ABC-2 type transport system ATP-binding protein